MASRNNIKPNTFSFTKRSRYYLTKETITIIHIIDDMTAMDTVMFAITTRDVFLLNMLMLV